MDAAGAAWVKGKIQDSANLCTSLFIMPMNICWKPPEKYENLSPRRKYAIPSSINSCAIYSVLTRARERDSSLRGPSSSEQSEEAEGEGGGMGKMGAERSRWPQWDLPHIAKLMQGLYLQSDGVM